MAGFVAIANSLTQDVLHKEDVWQCWFEWLDFGFHGWLFVLDIEIPKDVQ